MTRDYESIDFTVPLKAPLQTQAFIARAQSPWRLVVFPGTPCNRALFQRFLRVAPEWLEVVVIARPGFGKGHDKIYPDFDDQVAALKPFLPGGAQSEIFGNKKLVTMGVSYGGALALKSAVDFPKDVYGAITVAALIDEPLDYAVQLQRLGGIDPLADIIPLRWQKTRDEIEARRTQIGPLLSKVKELSAPVSVMHGDFDSLVSRSNADTLMEVLKNNPRAELEILKGGTHYLEVQYPRKIHAAIDRLIRRLN